MGGSGLGLALAESGWVERGACLSYFILRFLQRGCYFILYTLLLTRGSYFILRFLQQGCYFILPFFLRVLSTYFATLFSTIGGTCVPVCYFILCFLQRGCYFIMRFLQGGALYSLCHFILYFFTANIGVSGVPVCYFTLCFLQGLPLYTLLLNLAFNCVLVEAIPNSSSVESTILLLGVLLNRCFVRDHFYKMQLCSVLFRVFSAIQGACVQLCTLVILCGTF